MKMCGKRIFKKICQVFDLCCEDGMLDSLVLNNISNFLSGSALRNLLERRGERKEKEKEEEISGPPFTLELNSLPQPWRRNISSPHAGQKRNSKRK